MEVLKVISSIVGERYGKVLSICKGGSWLYTPQGKTKICVPRFVPQKEGEKLPQSIADELMEEEVLFFETDRGIVVKNGREYLFYPKGSYTLEWKH